MNETLSFLTINSEVEEQRQFLSVDNESESDSETDQELRLDFALELEDKFDVVVIDVNESEFLTSSLRPDLAVELELMNIVSVHKVPLAAFKSIYEWAVRKSEAKRLLFYQATKLPKKRDHC